MTPRERMRAIIRHQPVDRGHEILNRKPGLGYEWNFLHRGGM